MGHTGLEPKHTTASDDNELQNVSSGGAAECGASGDDSASIDPDLALVIGRWDDLPHDLRAGIVAMVRAAQ